MNVNTAKNKGFIEKKLYPTRIRDIKMLNKRNLTIKTTFVSLCDYIEAGSRFSKSPKPKHRMKRDGFIFAIFVLIASLFSSCVLEKINDRNIKCLLK